MIFSGVTATTTSSEDRHLGGIRVVTFMIYLSSVEAGGYTVFPQAGVSVKPELGSALYWFNYGAQNNYDSRTYHLGKNKDTKAPFICQLPYQKTFNKALNRTLNKAVS